MKSITSSSPSAIDSQQSPEAIERERAEFAAYRSYEAIRDLLSDLEWPLHYLLELSNQTEPTIDGRVLVYAYGHSTLTAARVLAAMLPNVTVEWHEGRPAMVVTDSHYHIAGREETEVAMARREDLRRMPYKEYLATQEWRERRERAVRAAGWRCQLCFASGDLHVHHRTYERRGDEAPEDLIALCAECHKMFHDHRELTKDES